jgi:hypothetical protein
VGVGLVQPGVERVAATSRAGRDLSATGPRRAWPLDHVGSIDTAFVTFLRLAACTGARRSQLLGLRWAEIDFEHQAIGFTRAYVDARGGPVLQATKTHQCYRVAIDDATMVTLLQHWRGALGRAQAAGVKLTAAGFVFSGEVDGARPWKPNRSSKTFIDHRRQATIPHFRLHDLRHFRAPPRCSPTVSRCQPCRSGSVTPACRPHSTSTPTASRVPTARQPTYLPTSSITRERFPAIALRDRPPPSRTSDRRRSRTRAAGTLRRRFL